MATTAAVLKASAQLFADFQYLKCQFNVSGAVIEARAAKAVECRLLNARRGGQEKQKTFPNQYESYQQGLLEDL